MSNNWCSILNLTLHSNFSSMSLESFISVTTLWHNGTNLSLIDIPFVLLLQFYWLSCIQDIGKFIWCNTLSIGYVFFINGDYPILMRCFVFRAAGRVPLHFWRHDRFSEKTAGKETATLQKWSLQWLIETNWQ